MKKHLGFPTVFLAILCVSLVFNSCKEEDPVDIPCEDMPMFGQPVAATGLNATQCQATCTCKNFTSKDFTPEQLASLREWTLGTPYEVPTTDPYDEPLPHSDPAVCAMYVENMANKLYSLRTYSDEAAAEAAGAILTHHDACGLCSSMSDFAVYAEDRDIGASVKLCALQTLSEPFENLVACIEGLGFTPPCAKIWAYNTLNTRENCFLPCFNSDIYHNEDGSLSECLQCDEDISGPVFKAVAGRTRRNTGLASSICRPCEEVKPVAHDYPF
jgi:hypothetical protein